MTTFRDLGLSKEIIKALDELEFKVPTPIQARAIPHLLGSKEDLIALAQTGTGKTAAFCLPILDQINPHSKHIQSIVICPTRELCRQIETDIFKFTKYINGVSSVAIYGGQNINKQIQSLKKKPNIVVGTPGRLVDLISRGILKIDQVEWLVLDEADEMLDMGFKDDLDAILDSTPDSRQTLLFSATMSRDVESIAKRYMNTSERIEMAERNAGSDNVEHHYYVAHAKDRYNVLKRLVDVNPDIYGIVFCRTRRETQVVADKLTQDHYNAEPLHGDMSQSQRNAAMQRFKKGLTQLLVATDVAARGIDVNNLTHVINYNLPDQLEGYVHRSGRTGRAHNEGISIAILHMKEISKIKQIERKIGKSFERKEIPTGPEICEKQLFALIDNLKEVDVNQKQIQQYIPSVLDRLSDMDRQELIKKFVSVEFNRFLEFYKDAPDLNVKVKDNVRKQPAHFAAFQINLGRKQKLGPKSIFDLLNKHSALRSAQVGNIEIIDDKSYFEIDASKESEVLKCLNGGSYKGKKVEVVYLGEVKAEVQPRKSRSRKKGGNRNGRRRHN